MSWKPPEINGDRWAPPQSPPAPVPPRPAPPSAPAPAPGPGPSPQWGPPRQGQWPAPGPMRPGPGPGPSPGPSPGPGPGPMPPGPGYGEPPGAYGTPGMYGPQGGYGQPGWGPPGPPPVIGAGPPVRHRPGLGLAVAGLGLLLLLLSLVSLPWISQGGQHLSLMDIRDEFEGVDPPANVEYGVFYARWIWAVVLAIAAAATLTSTAFVPSSKTARTVIGCIVFAPLGVVGIGIGALANASDEKGVVGPRVGAAWLVLLATILHLVVYLDLFTGDAAPDAGLGVWMGFLGLATVFVGCMIGTRVESLHPANQWAQHPQYPQYPQYPQFRRN